MTTNEAALKLARDEMVFAERMLPHYLAGKSAAECARAVLDDDARIVTAFFKRSESQFFSTPDERGRSHRTAEQVGDLIAREISALAYNASREMEHLS